MKIWLDLHQGAQFEMTNQFMFSDSTIIYGLL